MGLLSREEDELQRLGRPAGAAGEMPSSMSVKRQRNHTIWKRVESALAQATEGAADLRVSGSPASAGVLNFFEAKPSGGCGSVG